MHDWNMAETIRIDPKSHAALADIARAKHIPLSEALARAVEAYRRELLIQAMDADYAALRADSRAWAQEQTERAAWETTNADGLQDE
jgi:Spy/CpxP family protein refolding chaperone